MQNWLNHVGEAIYEEQVKAFEARRWSEEDRPRLLQMMAWRLFYMLKYRLTAPRKQAAQLENPCQEMRAAGQNGC
jgi:hypothetical protein